MPTILVFPVFMIKWITWCEETSNGTVVRLFKRAFHARPPLPRYTGTWNVQVVLDCMLQWGDTTSLSLKLLTYKLVMLMSLARPSCSADLASLCLDM